MNYFNYKPEAQMGKVWSLFERLGTLSEEEIVSSSRHDYSHTMDIIKSALAGNIPLSEEGIRNFNLQGYEYTCKTNDKIVARQNVDKELFIVDSIGEKDEDIRVHFGDISERKLKSLDTAFDEMLDNSDFELNLLCLCGVREDYIIKEGIDVVDLLYSALSGIKDASEILVNLLKKDSKLMNLVSSLCESCDHDILLNRLACNLGGV